MTARYSIANCIKVLVILFSSFVSSSLCCQQITFRQLSIKEGLSQNSAISITQDTTGYMWIATQDGLNKYDGRQFSKFPYNFVDITKSDYSNLGKVYTDREGSLWIIPMDRRPYKFDPNTATFTPFPNIDDASEIFQDRHLNLWIGTYNSGLWCLKPNTDIPIQVMSGSNLKGTTFDIGEDTSGKIIVSVGKQMISIDPIDLTHKTISPLTMYGEQINSNFSDKVFDKAGRLWIGTYGDGLYFKEEGQNFFYRISQLNFTGPLPQDLNILDLHLDKKDRLWIATYGRGLYMMSLKDLTVSQFNVDKHNPRALHYKDVLCIYEDSAGTLWFGTDGGGISYYDEDLEKFNSLTNYQTPVNISIDVVRAITVDRKNAVWIGTSGLGLTQYEPSTNSWRTFTVDDNENDISSNRIMSLFTDEENDIWIGTQGGGLNIYGSQGEFAYYNKESKISLSASTIWTVFEDKEGRIWLGTREQGLIQFDKVKGEIKKYTSEGENGLPSSNIRTITGDEEGNLWIGTEADGIAKFNIDKETFSVYGHSDHVNSLSNNNIKCLYYDPRGILWAGTNGGGLNALDVNSGKFYGFNEKDGLSNNVIYAILPDNEGNLWLSSNRGISKFTTGNNLGEAPIITNYDNYDGLATEFNTGAYHKDRKGNLYFGGLEGFYWFKPEDIEKNEYLPRTVITDFMVFNQPHPITGSTKLNHDQNTISLSFSSLQYSLPGKNQYQYRLVNYDKDWIMTGNNNFARYSFLPPGDYTFQVKSSNYDGVWNEQPASFAFTIASPWYLTPLLKIIYIVLFLALLYGIYKYLKWRWRMKLDLQIKEEEAERLKSINDFKSKLYTNISHEFRTPLTLISGPIDAKLGEAGLSDTDLAHFSMIKRNTNRLIALVDQLLHMAKLEKGKLKLRIRQDNLDLFIRSLASSFEYYSELKSIDYQFHTEGLEHSWYDEDAIEKIVTNLLSNAFKYCPKNGFCVFRATKEDGKVYLSIKNTVREKSEIDLDKLFDRFYQKNEYAEGVGVGLALVRELVELYRGEVTVEMDEVSKMIDFKVTLPADREYFGSDAIVQNKDIDHSPETTAVIHAGIPQAASDQSKVGGDELPIILIVEDQKEVREFLAAVWKEKYAIHKAENGKIGIQKAMEIIPDLIVTDVRMPECDGIELCNVLKTNELTSHIPIILLTAGVEEEDELKGLRSGADDFVSKPFKLRILEKRVENLIQTRKSLRKRYSQEVLIQAKDIAVTPTDEAFLNRVQQTLDEYLYNPDFNAAFFCKELGMSRMQLHRKLQAFTGLSTTEFIRSQRLKQALHILKTSDASINEVAYTVGFNTPSYFIKCFRETYRKTPMEYLQSSNLQ